MKLHQPTIVVKTWALWVKRNKLKAGYWLAGTLTMIVGTPIFTRAFQAGFLKDEGQPPVNGVESWLLGGMWAALFIAAVATVIFVLAAVTETLRYDRNVRKVRAADTAHRDQLEEAFLSISEQLFEARGVNTLEATVRAHDLLAQTNVKNWKL